MQLLLKELIIVRGAPINFPKACGIILFILLDWNILLRVGSQQYLIIQIYLKNLKAMYGGKNVDCRTAAEICAFMSMDPFVPQSYEACKEAEIVSVTAAEYENYITWYHEVDDVEFLKIVYSSEGLNVVGIIAQPKYRIDQKYPVIMYNRGGYNDKGKITVTTLKDKIYPLVQAGYVVVACQYRGNDGGQGSDECGGSDVTDVLTLCDVIKSFDYVDSESIFMIGYSRGGVNTYCAMRLGLRVKALAVIAGLADLCMFEQMHPDGQRFLEVMIPDPLKRSEIAYKKCSVMYWPEEISAPLLLLHGQKDEGVSVQQSILFAQKCWALNKSCELVLYPDGDHFLKEFTQDMNSRIIDWFGQYRNWN